MLGVRSARRFTIALVMLTAWSAVASNLAAAAEAPRARVAEVIAEHVAQLPNDTANQPPNELAPASAGVAHAGPVPVPASLSGGANAFRAMAPVRILDSRPTGPKVGPFATPWPAGATRTVPVRGVGGVPDDAVAVILNVTVTGGTSGSYLSVFPAGGARGVSTLNFGAGQTIANTATVGLGSGGSSSGAVDVYNNLGSVDVIFDVAGYYSPIVDDGFTALSPTRVLDSRPAGPQAGPYATPWGPLTERDVPIAGVGGVPDDATAVVLNVTVTNPTAGTFLTIFPDGGPRPIASTINVGPGQTIANGATVKLGASGRVRVFNAVGNADLVLDVAGYYRAGFGDGFNVVTPVRLLDSRPAGPQRGPFATPWGTAPRTIPIGVAGSAIHGPVPLTAKAVVGNLTVTNASAGSFLKAYPSMAPPAPGSSINFGPGQTIANGTTVRVGYAGAIDILNALGTTDVLFDLAGYFGPVADGVAPEVPSSASASASERAVFVGWTPSASPPNDVAGYLVFRSVDGGPSTQVGGPPVATSSYVDLDVAQGKTYVYRVKALDANGNQSGAAATSPVSLRSPIAFVVDSAADAHDASVGDGACITSAGTCTLRAAIDETNAAPVTSAHVVTFATGIDPALSLTSPSGTPEDANASGDLDVLRTLTIDGDRPGSAPNVTITGLADERVLQGISGNLNVRNVTITGARSAVYATGGNLLVEASTFTGNTTPVSGGSTEGIVTAGSGTIAELRGSTFTGNTGPAGQIGTGVVISNGMTRVVNSTFGGNAANWLLMVFAPGGLEVTASTLLGTQGVIGVLSSQPVRVSGSMIGSTGGTCGGGPVRSGGWNVGTDALCGLDSPSDRVRSTLLLAPLAANGGPTRTMLPYANSPAVDAIPVGIAGLCDASTPVDQRGSSRPAGTACDVGAVEGTGPVLAPLSLTVTTGVDGADVVKGDGVCQIAAGGCSLRAAIDEANARATLDSITIAPGVNPVLSLAGAGEQANATGDLDITDSVVIDGGGATVDGAHLDRVVHHRSGQLTIRNLALTGGALTSPPGTGDTGNGGALESVGNLVLSHVDVHDNSSALGGGGISARGGATAIADSTIHGNKATSGDGGGALLSNATVARTTVQGNTAATSTGGGGGGLAFVLAKSSVFESTITQNQSHFGGGITASAAVTLARVTVSSNTTVPNQSGVPQGGGIVVTAGLQLVESTVTANHTQGSAGGLSVSGPMTIVASTIDHNVAGTEGGGLTRSFGGVGTIERSTISDNEAPTGAAFAGSGYTEISASTIAANKGTASIAGFVRLQAVVISSGPGTACAGTVPTLGYNVAPDTTCGLTLDTDRQRVPVVLGALADNGGPTKTRLLAAGSAGLDTVPAGTYELCIPGSSVDQRGAPRPSGPACDAGAVEGAGPAIAPLSLTVNTAQDARDKQIGDGICATAAGACSLRAAIDEANARPTPDLITIATGTNPTLAIAGRLEDANASGDLDITDALTIEGNGATIDGAHMDRVVDGRAGSLTLRNLTIRGGRVPTDDPVLMTAGAGVSAQGDLDLTKVTMTDNVANAGQCGGSVALVNGTLDVVSSSFSNDDATTNLQGSGVCTSRVTARITASTFTHNTGGGVRVWTTKLTVSSTDFTGNGGNGGAGVDAHQSSDVTISGGIMKANIGHGSGAVSSVDGTLSISGTQFLGNEVSVSSRGTATLQGVLIRDDLSVPVVAGDGQMEIVDSTIEHNVAGQRVVQVGSSYATLIITRSTFSGNADAGTGLIDAPGNGIIHLTINASTFHANTTSSNQFGVINGEGSYGTISIDSTTITDNGSRPLVTGYSLLGRELVTTVRGSVLSSTLQPSPAGQPLCTSAITSGGWNTTSDSSCGFAATGDQVQADVKLGPLAANGGPTKTRAPLPASPLRNRIPAATPDICTGAFDQRGVARPVGGMCDVGAVET